MRACARACAGRLRPAQRARGLRQRGEGPAARFLGPATRRHAGGCCCPWRGLARAQAWRQGQTGYPLVDAAMRELWSTGWCHNRMRVVAASFMVRPNCPALAPRELGAAHAPCCALRGSVSACDGSPQPAAAESSALAAFRAAPGGAGAAALHPRPPGMRAFDTQVKNLLLPWQWGLKHYWDAQIDADLECDALGWQYVSGGMTGEGLARAFPPGGRRDTPPPPLLLALVSPATALLSRPQRVGRCSRVACLPADAHPFSHMMDLEKEAARFDPDGEYVRRWLPILARLPTKYIHAPWNAPPEVRCLPLPCSPALALPPAIPPQPPGRHSLLQPLPSASGNRSAPHLPTLVASVAVPFRRPPQRAPGLQTRSRWKARRPSRFAPLRACRRWPPLTWSSGSTTRSASSPPRCGDERDASLHALLPPHKLPAAAVASTRSAGPRSAPLRPLHLPPWPGLLRVGGVSPTCTP